MASAPLQPGDNLAQAVADVVEDGPLTFGEAVQHVAGMKLTPASPPIKSDRRSVKGGITIDDLTLRDLSGTTIV